jgi:sulfatase modifying factor 1
MQQLKTDLIQTGVRDEFMAPRTIQIPAGCFLMGSDAGQDNERPVHRVWIDSFCLGACQVTNAEYAQFLSATQHRKPLWEYAARGGLEQKLFPWGDEPPESLANYTARWKSGPEPVGRAEKNGYGLCDIGANIHEWCADWFDADYYRVSAERNPLGPELAPGESRQPARRSSRGGSWRHFTKVSRCSARSSIPPDFQYADYGFRVACEPPTE